LGDALAFRGVPDCVRQYSISKSEQSDPVPVRGAALDCAHHDHLGVIRRSERFFVGPNSF